MVPWIVGYALVGFLCAYGFHLVNVRYGRRLGRAHDEAGMIIAMMACGLWSMIVLGALVSCVFSFPVWLANRYDAKYHD